MMTILLISLTGLACVMLIVRLIGYYYTRSRIEVKSVKAGPTRNHAEACTRTFHLGLFDTFYHNGRKIDPRHYIVARVDGDCMAARGVEPGNIIFIQPFKEGESKTLRSGDILYIKYERNGFTGYKIREFDSMHGSDAVKTIYYTAENQPKVSSDPHKLSNVEGIVKFNFRM